MNRRNFFSVACGFFASCALPWRKANADPTEAKSYSNPRSPRGEYAAKLGRRRAIREFYPYPVVYTGDLLDSHYMLAGMLPRAATRGGRLFVNGEDRTTEAYEAFTGCDGWANLILKTSNESGQMRPVVIDGEVIKYSVRGMVEWRESDYSREANELLKRIANNTSLSSAAY